MRILITIMIALLSFSVTGQTVQENRGQQMAVGRWITTKGFRLPVQDTICNLLNYNDSAGCKGSMVYKPQDNKVYVKTDARWEEVRLNRDNQITVTKTQLDALISASNLVVGLQYRITNTDVDLYGGTDILLTAVEKNKLSLIGSGLFYTPKYEQYEHFDTDSVYVIGDTVTWGGRVWTNLTGADGTPPDILSLSTTDWSAIPYDTIRYNTQWDAIKYDLVNDLINFRSDKRNNVVEFDSLALVWDGLSSYVLPMNPIKVFKWGTSKVYGNRISNSYAETVSSMDSGSYFLRNVFTTITKFQDNKFKNTFIADNIFNNFTICTNNIFTGVSNQLSFNSCFQGNISTNISTGNGYIFYNTLNKGIIGSNQFLGGATPQTYIASNTVVASARILNNVISNGGTITNNIMSSNSYIQADTLNNTSIGFSTLMNSSLINKNNLTNSSISSCMLMSGGNITLNVMTSVSNVGATIEKYTLTGQTTSFSNKHFTGSTHLFSGLGGSLTTTKMLINDASGNATWGYVPIIAGGTTSSSTLTLQPTVGAGTTGADILMKVGSNGATEVVRVTNGGLTGIGTGSTVSAKLHVQATSGEILRLSYDASNYWSTTISSGGNIAYGITSAGTPTFTFNRGVVLNSGFSSDANATNSNLTVPSNNAASNTTTTQLQIGGATNTNYRVGVRGSTSTTITAGASYGSTIIGQNPATIAASGTHPLFANLAVKPLTITAGVGVLTEASSLWIENAPTGATNNYALHVAAGVSRFDGKIQFDFTNTAAGTTGAQTINKPSGSVNIAAGQTTITVTNNLVATTSKVIAVISTADATATLKSCVPGTGSFVITLGAAATAETKINFVVFN